MSPKTRQSCQLAHLPVSPRSWQGYSPRSYGQSHNRPRTPSDEGGNLCFS